MRLQYEGATPNGGFNIKAPPMVVPSIHRAATWPENEERMLYKSGALKWKIKYLLGRFCITNFNLLYAVKKPAYLYMSLFHFFSFPSKAAVMVNYQHLFVVWICGRLWMPQRYWLSLAKSRTYQTFWTPYMIASINHFLLLLVGIYIT